MISHISIRDFAIIKNASIDFQPGLNIITGETGSGKSIVIEAISLALGSRADTSLIRSGSDKAVVQLIADLDGEEMIITREINSLGRNLCKINGNIVTLAELAGLCKKIADIHGQYDHQSLLNPDNHIFLVDSYRSETIMPAKNLVEKIFAQYSAMRSKLGKMISSASEIERKRDFMAYELKEIKAAQLTYGEDEELASRINLMQNSEKVFQNLEDAFQFVFDGTPSSLDSIYKALLSLRSISGFSQTIKAIEEEFNDIYFRLDEASREMNKVRSNIDFSKEELDDALTRLDVIKGLKRKYGGSLEAVLAYANELEEKLSTISNFDGLREKIESDLKEIESLLVSASEKLTIQRLDSAKQLESLIQNELKELKFNNSLLSVHFSEKSREYSANGTDIIEFLISTNKGEPLKPLSKIASGGELSRIMLAFKKIIADYDNIGTLIFDEIDSGISGIAASTVGKKLKQISRHHQVICITHLPQIAACGDHNFKIEKVEDDTNTYTTVVPLKPDLRVYEIARLIGGDNVTDTTLKSAEELISASSGEKINAMV